MSKITKLLISSLLLVSALLSSQIPAFTAISIDDEETHLHTSIRIPLPRLTRGTSPVIMVPAPAPVQAPVPAAPSAPIVLAQVQSSNANPVMLHSVALDRELVSGGVKFYTYAPVSAQTHQPARVLMALHGMGHNGPAFSEALRSYADQAGLVLVAPTLNYQNYFDPKLVRQDDLQMMPDIADIQNRLPAELGVRTQPKMLIFGFSRGAQLAHRFALAYPQRVLGVAVISAGSYTLPTSQFTVNGKSQAINFPFGCADLDKALGQNPDREAVRKVHFWLAVGAQDNNPQDVPHDWDAYIGQTRVERAQNFYKALQNYGADAQLTLFPGASHEVTADMRAQALKYLLSLS